MDSIDELRPYGYDPSKTEDDMRIQNGLNPRLVLKELLPRVNKHKLKLTWSKMTSLIVVRHPLDRLVSLYNNKFIHRVEEVKLWSKIRYFIIKKYRRLDSVGFMTTITPEEMVRYFTTLVLSF